MPEEYIQQFEDDPVWDGKFHGGYTPDVEATEAFCDSLAMPRVGMYGDLMDYAKERKDVSLWLPMMEFLPNWRRGAQGIGDCVSWGWALGYDFVLTTAWKLGQIDLPKTTAATESVYGGSRVEARGGRLGGYQDGSYGGAAAKWSTDWGCIMRLDYSDSTGVEEHKLTKYDKKKAKAWGNFGCGGQNDAGRETGKLDQIAKKYPCHVARVGHTDELTAAINSGYPVPVCSNVGFVGMKRNADGVVRSSGSWSHCMCYAGVRWVRNEEQYRLFQSWGKSCSGPDPNIEHPAISWCSWWTTKKDAQRILNARDSFAVSAVEGFPPQRLDWAEVAHSWRPNRPDIIYV